MECSLYSCAPIPTQKEPLAIPEVKTHKQVVGTQQRGHREEEICLGTRRHSCVRVMLYILRD